MNTGARPGASAVAVAVAVTGVVGSGVVDVAVAVLESTVPDVTEASTLTTSVNDALPIARLAMLHETVPFEPTAGVVQVQPPGAERETNVVPAGNVSDIATAAALLGPALFTAIA